MKNCRTEKTRVRLFLGTLAFVLAVACDGERGGGSKPQGSARAVSTAESAVPNATDAPVRWSPSEELRYSLELDSAMTLLGGPMVDLKLRAKVLIRARQAVAEDKPAAAGNTPPSSSTRLWVSLSDVALTSTQGEAKEEFDAVARELTQPIVVTIERGLVSELWLDPSALPFTQGILRTIASSLQVANCANCAAAPSGGTSSGSWTQEEYDATGRYLATYTGAGSATIQKQKERYLSITMPATADARASSAANIAAEVAGSSWTLGIEQGRLKEVRGAETVRANVTPNASMETKTRYLLSLESFVPQAEAIPELPGRLRRVAPGEPLSNTPSQAVLDAARIGKLTFPEVLRTLEAGAKHERPSAERVNDTAVEVPARGEEEARVQQNAAAFHALVAMVRQKQETLDAIKQAVAAKSAAMQFLFDGLSTAGTDEAQALLVAFLDKKEHQEVRWAAATSLIRLEAPTTGSVDALVALLDDPKLERHGLYGLGTACRKLRVAGQTERARAVGERLREELAKTKTDTERVVALRAIANSGYLPALPDVKPLIESTNASVRGSALEALRLMETPEVDTIIATRLAAETEEKTLESAINAASTRDPNDVLSKALDQVLRTQASPHVRLAALKLVGIWAARRTELQTTLAHVSEHDEKPHLRDLATKRLAELKQATTPTTGVPH